MDVFYRENRNWLLFKLTQRMKETLLCIGLKNFGFQKCRSTRELGITSSVAAAL